jgi:integrase
VNLTAKTVAGLELPAGKTDHIAWDREVKGFGFRLRTGAGGHVLRSWVVQYRRAGGSRRITLGNAAVLTAEQARIAARKLLGAVAIGEDPAGDRADRRAKDAHSFRSVVEEYLAAKKADLRPRTFVETTRYLTGDYFKALHGMPVDTITRKDIAGRLVAITRQNSSIVAARARAVLSAFFVWTMSMGYLEDAKANPVIGTIEPKGSEGRTRVLTDDELAAIWNACGDDDYGKIVRLMILTGCRRKEIGGMRWGELDEDAGTWTIPKERAKNKRAHKLPLPAAAWEIIGCVPKMAGRDCLFGTRADAGFTIWGIGKAALDRALGDTVAPFVLHDVRRAVATGMADIGIQPHIIEQVLNHVSGHKSGVAGIYNRSSYEREVKTALAMWSDHVRARVAGEERVIVPFGPTSAA